ncbi:MAG: ribosome small subunit-dependent GTPase A [Lachnospiraceae bacterium]|nr:ribosome small subunit-dependent GTPase A [Candidatus Equihabitans merdae]
MKGKIIKGIAGFYYVHIGESGIYECKARGIFRKQKIKPLVGDDVMITIQDEGDKEGWIEEILPRKNSLIRPASANVDQALVLFSFGTPAPNLTLLDRFLVSMETEHVPCLVGFNKCDLAKEGEIEAFREAYCGAQCELLPISVKAGIGLEALRERLEGKTTVLAGPSGVGKSSLTNTLQSEITMEVGDISRKLMRGKNTTRHAQLIPLSEGTYLMDTPGFTAFELRSMEKEALKDYYPEFAPYTKDCYFDSCVHLNEPKCGVKDALRDGLISPIRYENYKALYEELYEMEKRRYQ